MSVLNRAMKNGRSRDTLVAVEAALAGLVVAFALYGSTLGHPFLSDDATHIVTNPTIARLSATGLTRLWITPYLVATALAPVSAYATLVITAGVAVFYALPVASGSDASG